MRLTSTLLQELPHHLEAIRMAKMTKAQSKKRLKEAHEKVRKVVLSTPIGAFTSGQEKKLSDAMDKIAQVVLSMK